MNNLLRLSAAVLAFSFVASVADAQPPGDTRLACVNMDPGGSDPGFYCASYLCSPPESCNTPKPDGGTNSATGAAARSGGALLGDNPPRATGAGSGIDFTRRSLYRDATDVSIPVAFGSLNVTRHYSSMYFSAANEAGNTMFGRHWHCSYEAHIAFDTEAECYMFIDEVGNVHHFPVDNVIWESRLDQGPPMELGVYEWGFVVTRADRSKFQFDEDGKLVLYDPDSTNLLDDEITLEYDGYGRLEEVHAPGEDDRFLKFNYTGADSKVTSVALMCDDCPETTGYMLAYYWYWSVPETLGMVKWNDPDSLFALLYEYGTFDGEDLENPDDLPALGRISHGMNLEPWQPVVAYGWYEEEDLLTYPGIDYAFDADLDDWTVRMMVTYGRDYDSQVVFGTDDENDPLMAVIADFKRDITTATYANAAPSHSTYLFPVDPEETTDPGDGEGTYRLKSASRLGEDEVDDPLWMNEYDLENGTFLNKYRLLSRTTYGAASEGTPMTTEYEYDSTFPHKIATIEGPTGETVEYTYHTSSNAKKGQVATSFDGVHLTSFDYDSSTGFMTSMTTDAGTTTFDYDDRGHLLEVVHPDGNTVTRTYNAFGQVLTEERTHLGTTTYTYSDDGGLPSEEQFVPPRLVKVEDAESNTSHYYYNPAGQVTVSVDPNDLQTTRTYDILLRLAAVTNPANETVEYDYDAFGRMTAFRDGRGKQWSYTYDEFGRRVRETDPDSYYTELAYSNGYGGCGSCGGSGSPVKRIRRQDGTFVSLSYDLAGRLTGTDYESIGAANSNEVTYTYDDASRVLSVTDTRLNLGDEKYEFTYDYGDVSHTRRVLVKVEHPEGYTQEFFFDEDGHQEAYRDVDGNISEMTFDGYERLSTLVDAYGDTTTWTYATTSDTAYPVGAVMQQTYGNGAKNLYAFDSLGRLEEIDHRNSSNASFDAIGLAYDPAGLITEKSRTASGGYTTFYQYDDAYRLAEELNKTSGGTSKSKRTYEYDAAGNRIEMVQWNDDSINVTTEYTYGNREQMVSNTGYLRDGTTDTGAMTFAFDSRGNMTGRNWTDASDGATDIDYTWNGDNRLVEVTTIYGTSPEQVGTEVQFHYDNEGRRLLRRGPYDALTVGPEPVRTRYFFHGLTEDITKVSVPGGHGDGAFEFVAKEDGDSASEWYASISGSGISVSSVSDSPRRSNVIRCTTNSTDKPTFRIGEKDGTSENPNDSAWNSTKRVVSFWMKGGASAMNVQVSASTGAKYVQYVFGEGTSGSLSGGNVRIYLGYSAASDWQRFERNVEADFEAYVGGGATWTNTDGLYITWPQATPLSYAFYIDDIRLSDSLTVEHNTLGPGSIGHILRHTTWDATTLARTDRWFHYDQVGSVMNETNSAGTLATTHHMDAFGNMQVSWDGGLWDHDAVGSVFRSFHRDRDVLEMYSLHRWMTTALGLFFSASPHDYIHLNRYGLAAQNPNLSIGSVGPLASANDYAQAFLNCSQKEQRFCAPNYTDGCRTYANCMCGPGGRLQACMAAAGFPLEGSWTITQDMGTFHDVCTLRWNGLPICITHKLGILVPMWSCNGDYGQSQTDSESNSK